MNDSNEKRRDFCEATCEGDLLSTFWAKLVVSSPNLTPISEELMAQLLKKNALKLYGVFVSKRENESILCEQEGQCSMYLFALLAISRLK